MKLKLFTIVAFFISLYSNSQVGIGTTTPAAALDVSSTNDGFLLPRVALSATNVAAPLVAPVAYEMVFNTFISAPGPNAVTRGIYYWNTLVWVPIGGSSTIDWSVTGNAATDGGTITTDGTNYLGTSDAQNINFRTSGIQRGRFSTLGEFFVNTLNTVVVGDLLAAQGNATFPWAVNGYTALNGGGTYGQVTGGTSIFGGVQGEYNGTNASGAGVRGIYQNTTPGTSFASPATGVNGNATASGTFKFGVLGAGGTSIRSGGVLGNNIAGATIFASGSLGYYSSALVDYSVYGFGLAFTQGGVGGRPATSSLTQNANIGLGIYGGAMGGWVRGMKYGFHTKGDTYSLYVDGSAYTNKPLSYLVPTENNKKVATFMTTSIHPEVTVNGKVSLQNGAVFVPFDSNFSVLISSTDDLIITTSPQGKSNGVYIDEITTSGFWIRENNNGISNVKVAWIAMTKIKGQENPVVPEDVLDKDFDKKMDGVMHNENNKTDVPQSMWWDGTNMRWEKPNVTKIDTETERLSRPGAIKK